MSYFWAQLECCCLFAVGACSETGAQTCTRSFWLWMGSNRFQLLPSRPCCIWPMLTLKNERYWLEACQHLCLANSRWSVRSQHCSLNGQHQPILQDQILWILNLWKNVRFMIRHPFDQRIGQDLKTKGASWNFSAPIANLLYRLLQNSFIDVWQLNV